MTDVLCCAIQASSRPKYQQKLYKIMKISQKDVWSSCLCRVCAGNLEYTVGWTAKRGSPQCHLPTQLEDVTVSTILGTLSALEALCDYALYKSTFTLHYIYILIKNLYLSKQYGAQRLLRELPDKGWKLWSIDSLLKRSHKMGTIIPLPGSVRPRLSRSSEIPCAQSGGQAKKAR